MSTTHACTQCNSSFKVLQQEADFYNRKNLPDPIHCPSCRHKQRMALRSERALYKRTCDKCQQNCLSTFPESAPYIIYCQSCYWGEM